MYDYSSQQVLSTYKFTGKEHDSESGLDNFGARFDSPASHELQSFVHYRTLLPRHGFLP
jgi:hypothetical protein